jgi:ankyrin repeat protein
MCKKIFAEAIEFSTLRKTNDMLQFYRFISAAICSLPFSIFAISQSTHPLFIAVKNNDIKKVKSLLDDPKVDVNILDDDSDNILMSAALYAQPEIMELLLKKGIKVNGRNKAGQTALMWSANERDKLELLLKYGANIKDTSNSGNTVLLIGCVGSNKYEIVKFLLDKGADASAKNSSKETALMRAAQFGDTATISLLLKKGIDINAKDQGGSTALMQAIANSNREVVFQLLESGADPDIPSDILPSALCEAVIYNDIEVVKAILKKTKNVIAVRASLLFAVYNEHDNTEIIQTLIDNGADVNFKSPEGITVLAMAMQKGNTATVALLKQAGAK